MIKNLIIYAKHYGTAQTAKKLGCSQRALHYWIKGERTPRPNVRFAIERLRINGADYQITLPFPVSVNALYGGGSAQKRFPSKKNKEWHLIAPKVDNIKVRQPCHIEYTFYWPDNRDRDGQNYMKQPLDYLVKQGVLEDDNYNIVNSETWKSGGVDKENPRCVIEITLL